MAEDKNTVVVYTNWGAIFDKLDEDEAGRLIKHFFNYVRDLDPEPPDRLTELVFEPMRLQLKKDLIKWNETKNGYSKAGKASAEARKIKRIQLYVIECFNEQERFIKVGITNNSISIRFASTEGGNNAMPYNFKVVGQHFFKDGEILPIDLENLVKQEFSKYSPKIKFNGNGECFEFSQKKAIINFIQRRSTSFNVVEIKPTILTEIDNVNANANASVNVIVKKNKLKELEDRKLKFAHTLSAFSSVYSREMLKDFYEYWTEPNNSGTKFRREMQKTWDLSRRLETWAKNERIPNSNKKFNRCNERKLRHNQIKPG